MLGHPVQKVYIPPQKIVKTQRLCLLIACFAASHFHFTRKIPKTSEICTNPLSFWSWRIWTLWCHISHDVDLEFNLNMTPLDLDQCFKRFLSIVHWSGRNCLLLAILVRAYRLKFSILLSCKLSAKSRDSMKIDLSCWAMRMRNSCCKKLGEFGLTCKWELCTIGSKSFEVERDEYCGSLSTYQKFE